MQRVFVTGGSGFVGRNLIPALRARGIAVVAMARSDASVRAVEALGAEAARCDLADVAAIEAGARGCDTVLHAAANVDEHASLRQMMTGNVDGTKHVLAATRAAGATRFVHVSTEAVLADGKPIIRADETRPRPARPAGPYPITKGLAEEAVLAANAPGFATMIVRPRFIWGRGDTSLLPNLVRVAGAGKWRWFGGGRYPSSTCHIDNVVEGTLLAAERGRGGEIYFLTDGEPVEFRDFLTRMLATQGVDVAHAGDVPRWVARALATMTAWLPRPPLTKTALALISHEVTVDDSKARRELGYRGARSVADGLAAMRTAS